MAYLNNALFRATSAGTGAFVPASAIQGYQLPATAGAVNSGAYDYRAESDDLTEWEYGTTVYTSAGSGSFTRVVVGNHLGTTATVNFTAAPKVGIVELAASLTNASLFLTGTMPSARLGSGTANSGTFLRGDSTWQAVVVPVAASQAEMEAASSTTAMVTPQNFKWSPFACKVWVKWGSTTTIDASAGVSSITDNGTGDWTINFSTAFSSANYSVGFGIENNAGSPVINYIRNGGQATGSCRVICYDPTGVPIDPIKNHLQAFGDQ